MGYLLTCQKHLATDGGLHRPELPIACAFPIPFSKPHASFTDCLTLPWLRYCIAIEQGKIRMMSMMYQAYQNHMDLTAPWRIGAAAALRYLNLVPAGTSEKLFGRLSSALELISRTALTYTRPAFNIGKVLVGNAELDVTEEVVFSTPFGSLLHFKKENSPLQPRVLLVAPMSGHFATLLRGTVKTLLQDHDVYITDWHNPRDIPVSQGKFGLDEYTEHLITFLNVLGPRSHMIAICQPSVSALAAAAIMSEDDHPARPASLTLMAGPIDTRIQPTKVNDFAKSKPLKWFEDNLINYVPIQCKGAFRKVYPGFVQLTAFVSMNLERHIKSHVDLADHLAKGETEKAEVIKTFYDEYFAVMDLSAEFYIDTIRDVFQEHLLPQGKLMYKGRTVNPGSIKRMGLMTVEGEKDDICSIGQTLAAQDLCTGVRAYRKVHHMQAGVGHYGVFSGRRWNNEIYPLLRDFVHVNL
jgi:poly(3-hydroxybutyrate) depolymerase